MAQWRAPVPPSDEPLVPQSYEPLVILLPPKDHPEQVIKANSVVNLEEDDGGDDDLEQIDDPRGVLDHQDY